MQDSGESRKCRVNRGSGDTIGSRKGRVKVDTRRGKARWRRHLGGKGINWGIAIVWWSVGVASGGRQEEWRRSGGKV